MLAACKQAFFAESPTKLWTFRLVIIKCTEDLHSRRKDSPKKNTGEKITNGCQHHLARQAFACK